MNFIYLAAFMACGIVLYEFNVLHVGFELAGAGFHILADLANSNAI